MDLIIGWNSVCLACLQEGEMKSIYEKDDEDIMLSEKIMMCSSIVISQGMNLPEQICLSCYDDLNAAYRFRKNCDGANTVYKSNLISNYTDLEIPSQTGGTYKYRLPSGLNVKRIKVKPKEEPDIKMEKMEEDIETLDEDTNHFEEEQFIITEMEDQLDEDDEPLSELKKKNVFTREDHDGTESVNYDENLVEILEQVDKEQELVALQIENNSHHTKENMSTIRPVRKGRPRKSPKVAVQYPGDVKELVENLTSVTYVRKVARVDGKPMKICEICGNTYKYQHALESHMRRHRNEKPFSCEFCDRAFVANVELRRHMRVHTGQKPYPCRYCSRRFSDFGSRIKHERTHTGERPYECTTCGKAFAYAHVLSVHVLTHTGEKKFKCEVCGKGFTKKVYLLGHMKLHSDMVGAPSTTTHVMPSKDEKDYIYVSPKLSSEDAEVYYES